MTRKRQKPGVRTWVVLGCLLAATLGVYYPAWRGAPVWDDDGHLTRGELRSAEGLRRIWVEVGATQQYYPVVHSAFWAMDQMWGQDTLGYHIVNIVLHALSAFLVFVILTRLGVPGALIAAGIFALHPVHVESVAWMTELKNTLSGVFYLLAALVYLRFDDTRTRGAYALALLLFVLALLSKTVTATLPAALLVVFWWKRGSLSPRRDVLPLLPFFALGIAGGLMTAWVERTYIGAQGFEFDLSPVERVLLACRALWFYAVQLVSPADLIFIYPRWQIDAGDARQYLYLAGVIAVVIALWLLRGRTRAPLAAALLFAGTLFPALGFFDIYPFRYTFVADHFQYLASIPLIALAAAGIVRFIPRRQTAALVVVCATLGVMTWLQSRQYVSAETLYRATLDRNPACWLCHNNLAAMRMAEGQFDVAMPHLRESLRLNPRNAEALNNYGFVLRVQGRHEDAVRAHEESLRLAPNAAGTLNNLGIALQAVGRHADALTRYDEALRLEPQLVEAHHNRGRVLQELGRPADALRSIETALRLRPDYADAHENLGDATLRLNRPADALQAFERARQLNPGDERLRRKIALVNVRMGEERLDGGRSRDAIPYFRAALQTPTLVDAPTVHNNLGIALAMNGDVRGAGEHFEAALRLRPDFPEAKANLARLDGRR